MAHTPAPSAWMPMTSQARNGMAQGGGEGREVLGLGEDAGHQDSGQAGGSVDGNGAHRVVQLHAEQQFVGQEIGQAAAASDHAGRRAR